MRACYECYSKMVEVVIVDRLRHRRKAYVCINCGRTVSKDKLVCRMVG